MSAYEVIDAASEVRDHDLHKLQLFVGEVKHVWIDFVGRV